LARDHASLALSLRNNNLAKTSPEIEFTLKSINKEPPISSWNLPSRAGWRRYDDYDNEGNRGFEKPIGSPDYDAPQARRARPGAGGSQPVERVAAE
jgi:hypothetical protein